MRHKGIHGGAGCSLVTEVPHGGGPVDLTTVGHGPASKADHRDTQGIESSAACQYLWYQIELEASILTIEISEQLRAARALLRWEQKDLASASGVSLPTIKRLETKPGSLNAHAPTLDALRRALEGAGIQFIPENGGGPGVRLRHPIQRKTTGDLRVDNPPAEDSD
jgi:hypothetical protein